MRRLLPLVLLAALLPQASHATTSYTFTIGADQLAGTHPSFVTRFTTGPVSQFTSGGCFVAAPGATEFGVLRQHYEVVDGPLGPVLFPLSANAYYQQGPVLAGRLVEAEPVPGERVVMDERVVVGSGPSLCVSTVTRALDGARPFDMVVVYGTWNATIQSPVTFTVPATVTFLWNDSGDGARFAGWRDFHAPTARATDVPYSSEPGSTLTLAAGGRLTASVAEGMFGSMMYKAYPQPAHASAVLAPDGPILAPPFPQPSAHAPSHFAGAAGTYVLAHGLTVAQAEYNGLVAAWVDAPVPPGVQPRVLT